MSTIKEEIKRSGRYEEIMDIINELYNRDTAYPVGTTVDDNGEIINWIETEDIKAGIDIWKELINTTGEEDKDEITRRKLNKLHLVIDRELEIKLHNYANSCAHRETPSEDDLEEIRTYEILNSSLNGILFPFFDPDTNEFYSWTVPSGWKKIA